MKFKNFFKGQCFQSLDEQQGLEKQNIPLQQLINAPLLVYQSVCLFSTSFVPLVGGFWMCTGMRHTKKNSVICWTMTGNLLKFQWQWERSLMLSCRDWVLLVNYESTNQRSHNHGTRKEKWRSCMKEMKWTELQEFFYCKFAAYTCQKCKALTIVSIQNWIYQGWKCFIIDVSLFWAGKKTMQYNESRNEICLGLCRVIRKHICKVQNIKKAYLDQRWLCATKIAQPMKCSLNYS